jgi:hypothetical protein
LSLSRNIPFDDCDGVVEGSSAHRGHGSEHRDALAETEVVFNVFANIDIGQQPVEPGFQFRGASVDQDDVGKRKGLPITGGSFPCFASHLVQVHGCVQEFGRRGIGGVGAKMSFGDAG